MEDGKNERWKNERWKELCGQAAIEKDPEKLHELIEQIDRLLEEEQDRLEKAPPPKIGEP